MGPLTKNPKCRVILNGIPIETFAKKIGSTPKAELARRYGIPADAPVIGNFGRLDPVKNHVFLLQIFNRFASTLAALFIGGEGPLRSTLEQKRDQLALRDRIFMPGQCTNAPELLGNLFDCFVLPSQAEGLPISMIEAVAAGLYVVCSDTITKDIAKVFPDRITALPLSAPPERWAEAVEQAIGQRIPPEQGLELVRHAPMNFDHFANEVIKIYETADR
jgi:glycosyltransferase involved in cell wall biosynthesis